MVLRRRRSQNRNVKEEKSNIQVVMVIVIMGLVKSPFAL